MFVSDLLSSKHVLVTGGGTGLGRSMAYRFVQLGARVTLCGRRQAVLEETAQAFRDEVPGAQVMTIGCDIRNSEAVDRMMDAIWAKAPLDVLVNNAAGNFIAQTNRMSARAADAILGTTLHGAMYCTMSAGRRWIESGRRGVVLSILSTSTITGRAFTTPSAMAKSGILAMTRSLAVEWGPLGVRLVAIAPGVFPTEGAWKRLAPAARGEVNGGASNTPLGRVGEHHELANLATFLISDGGGYINGEMVTIDGGMHLRTSGAEDLLQWNDADWDALNAQRSDTKGAPRP